ncbi:hypothetical protein C1Y63_08650 [Corynebacterium sp. 13CS0277]|uniref:hypothetical protein n=1 Tax=Corynebacterium sp. 13CS0277 TaxID=2071994 RepID=UPI000D0429A6|nr:hypothetical protein [Corynebacterium sp. 13CS0277]PRQ10923.1 hypothetical protein C1Y63_08650 [Corynebacterium sp. 13CS0277]
MFGYTPSSGDHDFFPPNSSTVPAEGLLRTKARYYQLAVWSGIAGGHEIFLGNRGKGFGLLGLLAFSVTAAGLGIAMSIGWFAFVPLIASFALWLTTIMTAARADENEPPFGTMCPRADVVLLYRMFAWNGSMWGHEFWGRTTPPPNAHS